MSLLQTTVWLKHQHHFSSSLSSQVDCCHEQKRYPSCTFVFAVESFYFGDFPCLLFICPFVMFECMVKFMRIYVSWGVMCEVIMQPLLLFFVTVIHFSAASVQFQG